MIAHINGINIYYETFGDGDPLLLIPGGPGASHVNYKKRHMELAKSNQLIMFDPRGAGKSERCPIETYDLAQYVADVDALRQHLGFDKINILGKSNGGVVAQAYALKHQEHIDHLLLVATTPSYHFAKLARKNIRKRGTTEQIAAAEQVLTGTYENQDDVNHVLKILQPIYSDRAELIDKSELDQDESGIALEPLRHGFQTYLTDFNFVPQLHTINSKTLIIAGDHDWVCDPSLSKIMHEKIPNSLLVILDGGHLMDHDQPQQYIEAIDQFLKT